MEILGSSIFGSLSRPGISKWGREMWGNVNLLMTRRYPEVQTIASTLRDGVCHAEASADRGWGHRTSLAGA